MPPCAHTECDRLTGTSEKRRTGTFASQSLMTVMRPASPPPTTITRRTAPDDVRTMFLVATIAFLESDRKSTRLNSSHLGISYAVFCLKKKKKKNKTKK